MKRREMLMSAGAAFLGLSSVPFRQDAAAEAEARGGKTYYIDPLADRGSATAGGLARYRDRHAFRRRQPG